MIAEIQQSAENWTLIAQELELPNEIISSIQNDFVFFDNYK
jgi:hypothetical protein